MTNNRYYICSFCAATIILNPLDGNAQEASSRLEEVVVTAQKRDESLLEVPIAIDVIGQDFLAASGAQGLSDLEYAVPSVNFGRGERKTRGEITVRGVGDFSRNIGTDARVAVYIDDVPLARSSAFESSLTDIQQIEILKGPQGTLFGTNTIAGAINITTAEPEDDFSLAGRVEAGNLDHQLASLTINTPLTDNLLAAAQIGHVENEGYITNVTRNTILQGTDLDSGRLKLLYRSDNDKLTLRSNFDWLEENVDATNGIALTDNANFSGFSAAPNAREVAHDALEFEQREAYGSSLKANYNFDSGFELVSITAYRYNEFSEQSEEDYSPAPAITSLFDEKSRQWSQELRILSEATDTHDYVAGIFLSSRETETERRASQIAGPNGIFASVITPGILDAETSALFFNSNWRIDDNLELTAGFRLQHEDKEIDYTIVDGTGLFTNGQLEDKRSFSAFLPKFGIKFDLNDSGIVYYSISRGAKSGGWNADFVDSLEGLSFDQEFAVNMEIGYKQTLLDERLDLNIAAYKTNFDDFQVFQFIEIDGGTILSLTNAGDVTSRGVEFDSRLRVNNYIDFTLSIAANDAQFNRFENGGGPGIDYDGNNLPYAPEISAFSSIDINIPTQVADFSFHLDYGSSGGYFSNANNAPTHEIDSYHVVNGNLGIHGDRWSVSVWGKNLTDELNLRYRDVSFAGVERGFYNKPRTYGITLRMEY